MVLPEGYFLPSILLKRVTFFSSTFFSSTVMVQVAVLSPALAVIVAVPGAIALTIPFSQTVATAALSVVKVTLASAGVTLAVSCRVSPTDSWAVVALSVSAVTSGVGLFASGPQEVSSASVIRARERYR